MIRTEYDPDLIEKTVRLAARQDPAFERALHEVIDPLYALEDEDERPRAFTRAFGRAFAGRGLMRRIEQLLVEYPDIHPHVDRCIVRTAARRRFEGVELLVRTPDDPADARRHTLLIQVCPSTLLEDGASHLHLRRELLHVADMLDPAFAYRPDDLAGASPQDNLVRDRYRVLWDAYVDGRLCHAAPDITDAGVRHEPTFRRVFAGARPEEIRAALGHVLSAKGLRHDDLMGWARSPENLFCARSQELAASC